MSWEEYKTRYDKLPYDKKIELWKEYNLIPRMPKPTVWWNHIKELEIIAKRHKCSLKLVCNYMWYIVKWNRVSKIDPWNVCENAFILIKCLEFCKS